MSEKQYTVIVNPLNAFFKAEVWYKGEYETSDDRGFLVKVKGAKCVRSFRKSEQAKEYIRYIQEVEKFKGE